MMQNMMTPLVGNVRGNQSVTSGPVARPDQAPRFGGTPFDGSGLNNAVGQMFDGRLGGIMDTLRQHFPQFGNRNPLAPGGPVMTPGGGGTGAPIQAPVTPPPVVVPGQGQTPPPGFAAPMIYGAPVNAVGTSYGVNGAIPTANPYGLPAY